LIASVAGNLSADQLRFFRIKSERVTLATHLAMYLDLMRIDRQRIEHVRRPRDYSRVNSRNDLVSDESAIPERTASCLSARTATRVRVRFVADPRVLVRRDERRFSDESDARPSPSQRPSASR